MTLESAWRQTFTDYEIIVIDDGSTDDTLAYLSQISDRVTVITQPNRGPGTARNKGAENARGEYLAFLDGDDLWFSWTLETVARLVTEYDQPAIISARLVSFKDPAELKGVNQTATTVEVFNDFLSASEWGFFVGAGMTVVRRDEFLEVGGFSEEQMNLEDHDFILRLGTAEGFVQILEPPTLGWRRHNTSLTDQFMRSFQGCRYLIESEQRGVYPGGQSHAMARRRIITRHIRPWALTLARMGEWRLAWSLYKSTFIWNLSLYRWRYLIGFWPSFHESIVVAHSRR